ncbi:hypothetical protein SSS_04955 [Sarcoptes scabiei]|nr:hypothetical protein SSS_04955 [Sarcoptes scabiei]
MKFFNGILSTQNNFKLKWSGELTSSAGLFSVKRNKKTMQIEASIKLSSKLLSLRSRRDLVQVLLHEMIHAYIYFSGIKDSGPHGHRFLDLMQQINQAAKTNITVYHSFHDEVRHVTRRPRQTYKENMPFRFQRQIRNIGGNIFQFIS